MEKKVQIVIKKIPTIGILAGALALLLCVYQSCVVFNCDVSGMAADGFGIRRFAGFFLFFGVVLLFCVVAGKENLFRFRYLIAIICFIICVAMEITGSSIGCFIGDAEKKLLLGVSRPIRSDEWAILTPMTWTQYLDPDGTFSYYNSVIRAEPTDVFLEYGLPIATPLMIFKPFLMGYLFLPIAKGMAFFWCGRLIALAMVSFEFGRLITNDNRCLSIVYSVMITFSPVVQWWFAINGLVEMLLFLQLSMICFDRYLKDSNTGRRVLYIVIIGICAGGYALTMYPAWMIPLAYVLLGCILWVFYRNYTQGDIKKLNKVDFLPILSVLCILLLSGAYIYSKSHETFSAIMNTVYPGRRFENGGLSLPSHLFSFIPSLWYAVREVYGGIYGNVCECASFITLFPAGYLLFLHRSMKKNRDALCTIMVVISILLMVYCVIGVPKSVAAISLLRYSKSNRALVAWGFANVILLIRLIALFIEDKEATEAGKCNKYRGLVLLLQCSLLFSAAVLGIWASYRSNVAYYNKYMIITEALLFVPLYCLLCNYNKYNNAIWAALMISVCLISGALANPVRSGVDDISMNPEVQMIRQIVENDPEAIWIVEDGDLSANNLTLLAGARTINCTNIYPDLERWRIIDPDGAYVECYNRYADTIQVIRQNQKEVKPKFILNSTLSFTVYMSDEEMKSLGTKYVLAREKLSGDNLKLIISNGVHNVYAID